MADIYRNVNGTLTLVMKDRSDEVAALQSGLSATTTTANAAKTTAEKAESDAATADAKAVAAQNTANAKATTQNITDAIAAHNVSGTAHENLVSYTDTAVSDHNSNSGAHVYIQDRIDTVVTNTAQNLSTAVQNHDNSTGSHSALHTVIQQEINDAVAAMKNTILGGAGTAYDTLNELSALIEDNKDAIDTLEALSAGHVRFDQSQELTTAQKGVARTNIGGASQADMTSLTSTVNAIPIVTPVEEEEYLELPEWSDINPAIASGVSAHNTDESAHSDIRSSIVTTANSAVSTHNSATDAHADIRQLVTAEATARAAADTTLNSGIATLSSSVSDLQNRVSVLEGDAPTESLTWADIDHITAHNLNHRYFRTGDQLVTTHESYNCPFDILEPMREYTLENGATHNGLPIQMHYATRVVAVYDPQEALYDCYDGLAAGTYNFKVVNHPWVSANNNKFYQFTITQDVPAGGQVVLGNQDQYNVSMEQNTIKTFSSASSMTAIESVSITEGQDGTYLGQTDSRGDVNDIYPAYRGNGRWATSMVRQWLNTDKSRGTWWEKQCKWDRISSFATSNDGYMMGLPSDFKAVVKKVKVKTARNTRWLDGGTDETLDYFFPLSLEELNGTPQIEGVEGSAFDYWIQQAANETVELDARGRYKNHPSLYDSLKKYGINATTSARYCWLRSANRGYATAWIVYSTGYVSSSYALAGYYVAPACVI